MVNVGIEYDWTKQSREHTKRTFIFYTAANLYVQLLYMNEQLNPYFNNFKIFLNKTMEFFFFE